MIFDYVLLFQRHVTTSFCNSRKTLSSLIVVSVLRHVSRLHSYTYFKHGRLLFNWISNQLPNNSMWEHVRFQYGCWAIVLSFIWQLAHGSCANPLTSDPIGLQIDYVVKLLMVWEPDQTTPNQQQICLLIKSHHAKLLASKTKPNFLVSSSQN